VGSEKANLANGVKNGEGERSELGNPTRAKKSQGGYQGFSGDGKMKMQKWGGGAGRIGTTKGGEKEKKKEKEMGGSNKLATTGKRQGHRQGPWGPGPCGTRPTIWKDWGESDQRNLTLKKTMIQYHASPPNKRNIGKSDTDSGGWKGKKTDWWK